MKKIIAIILTLIIGCFALTGCTPPEEDYTDNPDEATVVEILSTVEGISDIECATEENDPNNMLNKLNSYNAWVVFTYDGISEENREFMTGTSLENGTDGGGVVEVFATEEDAVTRNEYLSCFDGEGFLDSGSHRVVGTLVIRTSRYLTATQQTELTDAIVNAFENYSK